MGLGGGWPFGRGGATGDVVVPEMPCYVAVTGMRGVGPPLGGAPAPTSGRQSPPNRATTTSTRAPMPGGGEGASEPVAYVSRWAASRMVHA